MDIDIDLDIDIDIDIDIEMHIHILLELRLRNAQISGFTDGASPIRSVTGSWIHTSSCTRWLARKAMLSLPPRARVVACGGNNSEWCETVHRDAPSSARIRAARIAGVHGICAWTCARIRIWMRGWICGWICAWICARIRLWMRGWIRDVHIHARM